MEVSGKGREGKGRRGGEGRKGEGRGKRKEEGIGRDLGRMEGRRNSKRRGAVHKGPSLGGINHVLL